MEVRMEYTIKLSENMVTDLILRKRSVSIHIEEIDKKYVLDNMTATQYKKMLPDETKAFDLFCVATRETKEQRVKLALTVAKDSVWYHGKIIFPSTPK